MEIAIEVVVKEIRTVTHSGGRLDTVTLEEVGGDISAHILTGTDTLKARALSVGGLFTLLLVDGDRKAFDTDIVASVRCEKVQQENFARVPNISHAGRARLEGDNPPIWITLEWKSDQMPFGYFETYTAILREKALI